MTSISIDPTLSLAYLRQLLINYAVIPVLLFQGALLHPYYEPDPYYRKLRGWLAPVIISLAIYSQKFRLFRPLEDYLHINYAAVAVPTFHVICVTLQYACHRGPARKEDIAKYKHDDCLSSSESDSDHSSSITNSDSQSNSLKTFQGKISSEERSKSNMRISKKEVAPAPCFGELARFSIWMTSSPRSLGYVWGPPENVLSPAPKLSVAIFLGREISKMLFNQIAIIAYASVALPSAAHPERVYGWLRQFGDIPDNRLVKFLCQKSFMLPWGSIGLHAFSLVGKFLVIWEFLWITLARLMLPASSSWRPEPFDTTQYPDLFSRPVLRTSLTEFWSKGWQSVFRRDFIFCGAEPLANLFSPFGLTVSRLAGLLGAMLMSGFLHEWGLTSSVGDIDWSFRTTKFFLLCGVGIALELIFRKLSGYRVKGILGWIWLWGWFSHWCEIFMDSWFEKGVGLAGMRGPLEANHWPLVKFLVPFGPILPDRVLSKFEDTFAKFFVFQ